MIQSMILTSHVKPSSTGELYAENGKRKQQAILVKTF